MDDEKELAEELERTREDADEWGDERVEISVAPMRTQVVSFRLPLEELETLNSAAGAVGESISQFIRRAIDLRLSRSVEPASTITGYINVITAPAQQRNEPDPSRAWVEKAVSASLQPN